VILASSSPLWNAAKIFFVTDPLQPGNEDHEDQVAAFRRAMEELKNLEGFRVGEIQINIFVLGTDDTGKVVGL
jgi:Nuclease A inhibitor-like protein